MGDAQRINRRHTAGVAVAAAIPARGYGCGAGPGAAVVGMVDQLHVALPASRAPAWNELAASLQGPLLMPGAPDFAAKARPWALQRVGGASAPSSLLIGFSV